jgi:hypothetical protein
MESPVTFADEDEGAHSIQFDQQNNLQILGIP